MTETNVSMKTLSEKLAELQAKTVEIRFLNRVTVDLRNYRKMIGIKKYD